MAEPYVSMLMRSKTKIDFKIYVSDKLSKIGMTMLTKHKQLIITAMSMFLGFILISSNVRLQGPAR